MECWKCGEKHLRRHRTQNQGDSPKLYSAQEAETLGDVGPSIPCVYAVVDSKQAKNQASIIEMDGKISDQVISILIDLGSNYSYVSPDLVDKYDQA